jgi:hypothetical protein
MREINIQNDDTRKNAIVSVKTLTKGEKSLLPTAGFLLPGGDSVTKYIQSLLIEEVQNG